MSKKPEPAPCQQLILFAEGSPAKTSAPQAKARALLDVARDFGMNLPESSESYSRDGLLSKTSRQALADGWTPSGGTWQGLVMKRYRSRCQQVLSGPPTGAAGSSWSRGEYPTPSASRSGSSNNGNPHDGRGQYATRGRPSLETWARTWKRSGHGESSRRARAAGVPTQRHMGTTLTDAACRGHGHPAPAAQSGKATADLNPRFVAALMGFPPGWIESNGKQS